MDHFRWLTLTFLLSLTLYALPPQSQTLMQHTGKVLEHMDSGGYTYMKIDEKGDSYWIAVSNIEISDGAHIRFEEQMWMDNFTSKTLNRTFKKLMFASHVTDAKAKRLPHMQPQHTTKEVTKSLYPLPGAQTVVELYHQGKTLNGKKVTLHGKVAKVSRMIMGKNWVHIVDGTRTGENDRIVFTSTQTPPNIGDVVTAEGILASEKDFGYGYFYQVIVEEASFH